MSNFPLKALATVAVVVAGAELSRTSNADWNKKNPAKPPKNVSVMAPVFGGFMLGLFLFAAGMASEYLASLLCLLLVIGSLLMNGRIMFTVLNPSK